MLIDVALVAVLLLSLVSDLKSRRIPNRVVYPAMVLGLVWHTAQGGSAGFWMAVEGLALGLALFLIPFLMGGLGAGDVKLLAAVGALKGPGFVFTAFFGTAVAGGLIAAVILLRQKKLLAALKRIGRGLFILLVSRFRVNGLGTLEQGEIGGAFPYGVAIGIGSLVALVSGCQWLPL